MGLISSVAECKALQNEGSLSSSLGVCIGNFDGVHLGHKSIFERLKGEVSTREIEQTLVLTFSPHPRQYFQSLRDDSVSDFKLLMSEKAKVTSILRQGIDYVFALPFDEKLAALTPEQFVKEILVGTLGARLVVVGFDWSFGRNRAGNVDSLKELGEKHTIEVVVEPPFLLHGDKVGSAAIKGYLSTGNIASANTFLGRPFSIEGKVEAGDGRGASLGFPTANISNEDYFVPSDGVYVSNLCFDGARYLAVTNIGSRPTFVGAGRSIETHVLDEKLDLYGKRIGIEFLERLRAEKKFENVSELSKQISADITRARSFFNAKSKA